MSRTINDVTLYDLMAEDLSVWIGNNKKFGFDLHIEGDDMGMAIQAEGVHPYAMDSFADMCRRFLYSYDRALEREELQLKVA